MRLVDVEPFRVLVNRDGACDHEPMTAVREPDQRVTGVFAKWRWPARTALALVVVPALVLIGNFFVYHEWPWSPYPSEMHLCGRYYTASGPPQSRAQLVEDGPITLVGDVPGWLNQGTLWRYRNDPPFPSGGVCRMVMLVQGGPDQFRRYVGPGG